MALEVLRAGLVERPAFRSRKGFVGYEWAQGYTLVIDGRETQPWMTRWEMQDYLRNNNLKARW
jgi:hypothetical protein